MILSRFKALPKFPFCVALLLCVGAQMTAGQVAPTQPTKVSQPPSIPLPNLYWALLSCQNHLDHAAELENAQGRDGSWLRNALQQRLGFSDTDFGPVHESAKRLAAAVKQLDAQAAAIGDAPITPAGHAQLREISTERTKAINAEIEYLTGALTPEKRAALDAFLPRFFVQGGNNSGPTAKGVAK